MRDISKWEQKRETEGSLYPDIHDTTFLSKLLRKREFRETRQMKITDESLKDNVCDVKEFEYTATQKFVGQFMSPETPYNGMLLYHGVGVGKTCTAILAAEVFLELSPKNKVYILAPPAIQPGFYRTIFDSSRIVFGTNPDEPNSHEGCTGNLYLELTQTQFEREKKDIELRVNRLINKRYAIMGYVAFRNMVIGILNQIPDSLPAKRKAELEVGLLQKALSGCLFIVDEAHNLRDVSDGDSTIDTLDESAEEKGDAAGGKKLTPILRNVLTKCEGNKLLLMSATPMYNSYKEIISLLNFLLRVDHVEESELLREQDIQFHRTESGEQLTPESEAKLIKVANGHVSFMRGENPKAFPSRLDPADSLRITTWPDFSPNGTTAIEPATQKEDVMRLPLVKCELIGDALTVIRDLTIKLVAEKGVGIRTIDTLLQAGNCIFPGKGLDSRVGSDGFQTWFASKAIAATFEGSRVSFLPQYVPALQGTDVSYRWMAAGRNTLGKVSPKFNQIIQTIKNATGISFVYSRFVENGAVIFCLLLEANGYSPWGRSAPLFSKGPVTPGGRQCAKCSNRELGHPAFQPQGEKDERANHKFTPAYYALLTASDVNTAEKQSLPLSPNNPRVVTAARDTSNVDGSKIKVIVGSQVAGEGLDLRAIREIHILEGWFHLSKQEQIIGRGIRYCSHQGLEYKYRNCTVNLYVNIFPPEVNRETIDQYSYRTAMNKAVRMGNVSRALRQGAADCNLNKDAILVNGLSDVDMIDSQRQARRVILNDKDFTPVCDWIRCDYVCKPALDITTLKEDNSTYDMYAARFAEQTLIGRLKRLFKEQVWFRWEDIQKIFKETPSEILMSLLMRTVNNPAIIFENGDLQGHIIYRNNLFLFQPNTIQDQTIPLALRYGRYPVKRDSYLPSGLQVAQPTIRRNATREPPVPATPVEAVQAVEAVEAVPVQPMAPLTAPDTARAFWTHANRWINTWAADGTVASSIVESIPNSDAIPLSRAILAYVDGDISTKDNIEVRLKKLQWWGRSIAGITEGLRDLRTIARQFVWDSFIKGPDQLALLHEAMPHVEEAGNEQYMMVGDLKALRYLAVDTKEPVYICADGRVCAPSVLQLFLSSKTDTVVQAVANVDMSAEIYGFMVPWENTIMFKTNTPSAVGKAPGGGAACSIVSNVAGHRKKITQLGDILARHSSGNRYDLTEGMLTGPRKLAGAPSFCALMEVIMRWMDLRKALYGNKRLFYRPLSAYYSKHRSKK